MCAVVLLDNSASVLYIKIWVYGANPKAATAAAAYKSLSQLDTSTVIIRPGVSVVWYASAAWPTAELMASDTTGVMP
jgi:hypothetical protein